ncbi:MULTISPECIES: hypothetical protein [unclassified Brenneria]|uniref:hypothetical protein n=1 Tax=unclassified Brenneria TaxID=2634434 RepID=UPI001553288F|nr:hypothetical protein [Brenneria sp. hezel4-2-4]MEE3649449.1 hypothetical protein [Brenneria sp. HEZEL_4_2_4]NPC99404.1 hypothetical protein [Brenneria sp. hezel4-2-4]
MSIEQLINQVSADVGEPELLTKIQSACRKKQAFCFGTDRGRIVLRPQMRNGVPYVFIWLAVSEEPESISRYLDEVKTLTRMAGGRWIEFNTARKGFIRIAEKLGFERLPDEEGSMTFKIPV